MAPIKAAFERQMVTVRLDEILPMRKLADKYAKRGC